MRPQTLYDWVAFALVIVGALAWGFFTFDVNILDLVLEAIWDPLDNIVFALIALAGIYMLVRAFMRSDE
ncbi:DUF378 domain-containing protein [Devosia nitrariae]|uniref:DUF378 domain-containing protein n=1 Tax=Devosia nitrariae TaxID=2071872 RepID=A0ABQ5W679_9HYPH|nr:DUF378 domain-containing protein [Devosia nitrariae]GLQ55577.1 hypothetical protein GCM10010862_28360 [Devosia nitrariae]